MVSLVDYLRAFLWYTLPVVVGIDEICSVEDRWRGGSLWGIILDGVIYWTAETEESLNVFPRWDVGSCKFGILSELCTERIAVWSKSIDFFPFVFARDVLRILSSIPFGI